MIIYQHRIYRCDLRANPNLLYLFGDNEARVGYGGQAAEMRDEPNAVGIATLASPGEYWGADPNRECRVIDADLERVVQHLYNGGHIVIPSDGLGTGIADLANRSPYTFAYLQARLEALDNA